MAEDRVVLVAFGFKPQLIGLALEGISSWTGVFWCDIHFGWTLIHALKCGFLGQRLLRASSSLRLCRSVPSRIRDACAGVSLRAFAFAVLAGGCFRAAVGV